MRNGNTDPLATKIILFILGIVLIVVGIMLIKNNNKSYNEYKKSPDKQNVVARIIDVNVRNVKYTERGSTKYKKEYDCIIEYSVNNNVVRYNTTYYIDKRVGETMPLKVYKDQYGNYQIATVTSEEEKNRHNTFANALIFIGALLLVCGISIKLESY